GGHRPGPRGRGTDDPGGRGGARGAPGAPARRRHRRCGAAHRAERLAAAAGREPAPELDRDHAGAAPHVRTARELAGGHLRPRRPGGARGRAGGHGGGAMSEVTRIPVGTDYDVLVGQGTTAHVAELLPTGVARVLLVHGEPLAGLADPVLAALRDAGVEVHVAAVPDAEAAKTVEVAADLWGRM